VTTGAIALLLIAVLLAVRHAADHAIDPVVMDPAELGLTSTAI
jgi:hypothetical protein